MTPESSGVTPGAVSGPRRPWTLWLALGAVGFEVVELVTVAVLFVLLSFMGTDGVSTPLLSLALMFLVLALGLVAVIQGLYRMHRWARPAIVAWQVLLVLFALSVLGTGWVLPTVALVPALLCLIGLFAPASLQAYDAALEQHRMAQEETDHS